MVPGVERIGRAGTSGLVLLTRLSKFVMMSVMLAMIIPLLENLGTSVHLSINRAEQHKQMQDVLNHYISVKALGFIYICLVYHYFYYLST